MGSVEVDIDDAALALRLVAGALPTGGDARSHPQVVLLLLGSFTARASAAVHDDPPAAKKASFALMEERLKAECRHGVERERELLLPALLVACGAAARGDDINGTVSVKTLGDVDDRPRTDDPLAAKRALFASMEATLKADADARTDTGSTVSSRALPFSLSPVKPRVAKSLVGVDDVQDERGHGHGGVAATSGGVHALGASELAIVIAARRKGAEVAAHEEERGWRTRLRPSRCEPSPTPTPSLSKMTLSTGAGRASTTGTGGVEATAREYDECEDEGGGGDESRCREFWLGRGLRHATVGRPIQALVTIATAAKRRTTRPMRYIRACEFRYVRREEKSDLEYHRVLYTKLILPNALATTISKMDEYALDARCTWAYELGYRLHARTDLRPLQTNLIQPDVLAKITSKMRSTRSTRAAHERTSSGVRREGDDRREGLEEDEPELLERREGTRTTRPCSSRSRVVLRPWEMRCGSIGGRFGCREKIGNASTCLRQGHPRRTIRRMKLGSAISPALTTMAAKKQNSASDTLHNLHDGNGGSGQRQQEYEDEGEGGDGEGLNYLGSMGRVRKSRSASWS
ncbi:hypothetical protein K438DRAFT_1771621 [Mycena galopus ATCC 62051]|nr:hypothetical protein K438DRAFT_1771621 [Mycena galopus ATCC 62051]